MSDVISWADFSKVDMRIGTIIEIDDFPEARNPSYKIVVDFGSEIGTRKSSAQLTLRYSKAELIGRQIIAVVNFPEKQIANMMSQCLILGAVENKDVILLQPEARIANGLKIG